MAYDRYNTRREITLADPSKAAEIIPYTAKFLALDMTPGKEGFPFVYECAEPFYRRREDGQIEKIWKSKAKGLPGGGGLSKEEPIREAAIREGVEELGVSDEVLRAHLSNEPAYTSYSGWEEHPFHVFWMVIPEKELKRGFLNRAKIVTTELFGPKADWARFSKLDDSILAPKDPKKRQQLEDRGWVWFYKSHFIYLMAVLLKLEETGVLPAGDERFSAIVFRKISLSQAFSKRMAEMLLTVIGNLKLLHLRAHRLSRSQRIAAGACAMLAGLTIEDPIKRSERDQLLRRVVEETDTEWREKLQGIAERVTKKRETGTMSFSSMEEMIEFHELVGIEPEGKWAEAEHE